MHYAPGAPPAPAALPPYLVVLWTSNGLQAWCRVISPPLFTYYYCVFDACLGSREPSEYPNKELTLKNAIVLCFLGSREVMMFHTPPTYYDVDTRVEELCICQ